MLNCWIQEKLCIAILLAVKQKFINQEVLGQQFFTYWNQRKSSTSTCNNLFFAFVFSGKLLASASKDTGFSRSVVSLAAQAGLALHFPSVGGGNIALRRVDGGGAATTVCGP